MEIILYMTIGIILGAFVGWLLAKSKTTTSNQLEKDAAQKKYNDLEKEIVAYKAKTVSELKVSDDNRQAGITEINKLSETINTQGLEVSSLNNQVSTANVVLLAANKTVADKNEDLESAKQELKVVKKEYDTCRQELATANANNESLKEKQQTQKDEIEALGKKFNPEFENIVNKILDTKTEKFTELNKTNLTSILEPLGKNIAEFKTKVEEVYDKESKERFSLGEKVKELAQLNKVISEEAHNLTRALKNNGVIFEKQSVALTFAHTKQSVRLQGIENINVEHLKKLEQDFISKTTKSIRIDLPKEYFTPLAAKALNKTFNVQDKDPLKKKIVDAKIKSFSNSIEDYANRYINQDDMGETAYAFYNVISDYASNNENSQATNKNGLQAKCRLWINEVGKLVETPGFKWEEEIKEFKFLLK